MQCELNDKKGLDPKNSRCLYAYVITIIIHDQTRVSLSEKWLRTVACISLKAILSADISNFPFDVISPVLWILFRTLSTEWHLARRLLKNILKRLLIEHDELFVSWDISEYFSSGGRCEILENNSNLFSKFIFPIYFLSCDII